MQYFLPAYMCQLPIIIMCLSAITIGFFHSLEYSSLGHLQTNITHLISYLIFSRVCVTHLVLDNHLSTYVGRAGRNYVFHVLKFFLKVEMST